MRSGCKFMKLVMIKAIGLADLTSDEMMTLPAKIEAVLKSRPLYVVKSNNSYNPLAPSHFLTGSSLQEIPLQEEAAVTLFKNDTS